MQSDFCALLISYRIKNSTVEKIGEIGAASFAAQDGASLGDPECDELLLIGLSCFLNPTHQARL